METARVLIIQQGMDHLVVDEVPIVAQVVQRRYAILAMSVPKI